MRRNGYAIGYNSKTELWYAQKVGSRDRDYFRTQDTAEQFAWSQPKQVKEKKERQQRKDRSIESIFLAEGKPGEVFYTEMEDRNMAARAGFYGRKVKTERVLIVEYTNGKDPIAKQIIKTTLL